MGLHHHRPYRPVVHAAADLAAMLMVVERGLDFAGPLEIAEPEDYPCEWCGHDHGRSHRGATLCAGCIAELDARGSEPRLHLSAADLDLIADIGPLDPGDDHDDGADRWEGDEE